jgi:CheY-like chemotaxis protein
MSATILVIDDHPGNLKLLSFLLERCGYQAKRAADAEEALRVLEDCKPELILMDLQLPGMSGLELTSKLRADPNHARTVIIAVTASAMRGDEERAVLAGCDGYIAKPIDTRAFPRIIEAFLNAPARP